MVYLRLAVPRPDREGLSHLSFWSSIKESLGPGLEDPAGHLVPGPAADLCGPVLFHLPAPVLRGTGPIPGLHRSDHLPLERGRSPERSGGRISVRSGSGTNRSFTSPTSLPSRFLFLLLYLPGQWAFVNAFLGGFMILAPHVPDHCPGPAAGSQGQVHGLQPDDGLRLRRRRHAHPPSPGIWPSCSP